MTTDDLSGYRTDRHYSKTRPSGWLEMVDAPARTRPRVLSRAELAGLSKAQRLAYNDARAVWHANLGPIRTPQLLALHDGLAEIVESNRQDGDKNKPAALIDAYPGLGKTTAVLDYATQYHHEQCNWSGDHVDGQDERGRRTRVASRMVSAGSGIARRGSR
jgi:hypothetical protein